MDRARTAHARLPRTRRGDRGELRGQRAAQARRPHRHAGAPAVRPGRLADAVRHRQFRLRRAVLRLGAEIHRRARGAKRGRRAVRRDHPARRAVPRRTRAAAAVVGHGFDRARPLSLHALTPMSHTYDSQFMDYTAHSSRHSARTIAALVRGWLPATSVLDVGCARGTWLDEWRRAGSEDIFGVDGDYV